MKSVIEVFSSSQKYLEYSTVTLSVLSPLHKVCSSSFKVGTPLELKKR